MKLRLATTGFVDVAASLAEFVEPFVRGAKGIGEPAVVAIANAV